MRALSLPARLGLALGVLLVPLRLLLISRRYFDTDELYHLHAALAIAHGAAPYKSFFLIHGPGLYALLLPLAAAVHGALPLISSGRALMLAFWAALLALQWFLPEKGAPPSERAFGVLFLAFFTTFALKSLEIRPDVPAAALLSGLLLLESRGRGPWKPLLLGAGAAAGFLVSLKLVYPAAGLLAAALWRERKNGPARFAVLLALGAAAPLGLAAALLASRGALEAYCRCCLLFSLRFQRAASPWQALGPSLLENPVLWAFAAWALLLERRVSAPLAALLAALAGFAVVPSAYAQYFLFLGPMLALFAAQRTAGRAAASAALLSFCLSLAVQARALREDNALQKERLACVETLTAPSDRVADTWTGDSFHRPHAGYYWFWPEDVRAMLDAQTEPAWRAQLEDPGTRGLIWSDRYMAQLPPKIAEEARARFRPSGCGRLYLRRD